MTNQSDLTRDNGLLEAFEDCAARFNAGEPPESSLGDYPHYASLLRPLLETVIQVRRATPNSAEIAEAQARVRDRLAFRKATRRSAAIPLMRLMGAAAAIMITAGILFFLGRNPDQGGFASSTETGQPATQTPEGTSTLTLSPVMSATPTVTMSATMSFTPSPSPTATFTATPTASETVTPSISATITPTFTFTATFTPTFTLTATFTRTQLPAPVPTRTPQPEPTDDHGGDDDGDDDSGSGDDDKSDDDSGSGDDAKSDDD